MADQVEAEIVPLFGTEAASPTGQAVVPLAQAQAPGAQEGVEKREAGPTQAIQPVAMAATVPAVPTTQTAVTTTTAKALTEDYYDVRTCTVVMTLQFYPLGAQGQARRMLLSIQNGAGNKDDLPLLAVINEDELGGPLPPALLALWAKLEADLPRRKQRQVERAAKVVVAKPITTPTGAKKQGATTVTRNPATPPPPPTTTTPIQKEQLSMGGLFDGM